MILAHITLEPNLEIAVSHILSAGFFFVQNNALCENDCQIICLVKIQENSPIVSVSKRVKQQTVTLGPHEEFAIPQQREGGMVEFVRRACNRWI